MTTDLLDIQDPLRVSKHPLPVKLELRVVSVPGHGVVPDWVRVKLTYDPRLATFYRSGVLFLHGDTRRIWNDEKKKSYFADT